MRTSSRSTSRVLPLLMLGALALTACGGSGGSDAKSTSTTAGDSAVTFTAVPWLSITGLKSLNGGS